MRNSILCLVSGLSLLAVGCGGTGIGGDGGANNYPDLAGAHLQSGTYTISGITMGTGGDGCGIAPLPATVDITNTGGTVSIGKHYDGTTTPAFNPPAYALGSGTYNTPSTAALMNSNITVTLGDGCPFTRNDTTNFTFTGNNQGTIQWTHTESGFTSAMCTANDKPATDPCTSSFQFTIKM